VEVQGCASSPGDPHDCGSDPREARAPPLATHSQHRIVPRPDWLRGPRIIESDYSEDPHWPCDVLELPFACILEGDIELTPNLPVRILGETNATGLRNAFQPCGHVHAIAEDVATVENDVPDIDPNAELDPPFLRHVGIALGHAALDIDGTPDRVHYAAELSQQPISGVLDNPPTVLGYLGIDEGAQVVLELGVRALFVHAGQPAVSSHVCRQDGCEPSFYALDGQGTPPLQGGT